METENLALEILEEGVDVEVTTEGFGCCFTLFVFTGYW